MEPSQQHTTRTFTQSLVIVLMIFGAVAGLASGFSVATAYFVSHPQIQTLIQTSSTTATVSQTQTDTSYSTETQTLVSTVVSTANGNYYGNPNYYPNYNYNYNNNPYPDYQCQYYPYNSQYCGNQNQYYQSYSGTVSQSGTCILFYTSSGTYYLDLSHLNGNPYPNGPVTIVGYIESSYYQGPCGAFPLLYVEISQ